MKRSLRTILIGITLTAVLLFSGCFCAFADETDNSALLAALTAAASLDEADYSAASYAPLRTLYEQYQPIAQEMSSQEEIDAAAASLLEAINSLKAYLSLTVTANQEAITPTVNVDGENFAGFEDTVLYDATVIVSAPEQDGMMFVGWLETVSKRILSDESTYAFKLSVNTSLQALYLREDSSALVFLTESGCLINLIEKTPAQWASYTDLDEFLPRVPYSYGYTNGRWDIESNALQRLCNGEMVIVAPVYDESPAPVPGITSPSATEIRLELHYFYDADNAVGSFVMNSNIPSSKSPQSVGMLFYYQKAANFNPADFCVTINNKMLTSQYDTIYEDVYITNMRKMTSKYNWAARGYATYYENGELKTVYSNQVNIVNTEDLHDYRISPPVAPTCTESGSTGGSTCFICGRTTQAEESIPALGHDYAVTQTDPTCTENGSLNYCCTRCGNTVTVTPAYDAATDSYTHPELLAYGHDFTVTEVTTPATLDTIGEAAAVCTRCGATTTQPYYIAYGKCGDSVNYAFDHRTGALTISGTGAMTDGDMANDSVFAGRENITSVTVENGVTHVGSCAFYQCPALESVTLADTVTDIGNRAFYDCQALADVDLGGVETIDYYAFYRNTALTDLVLPASVVSVGDYVFSNCTGLRNLTISNGVKTLGRGAFTVCSSLTDVVLPNSVTSVDISAFANCTSLVSVTLSSAMTRVEETVFSGCTSLQQVTMPNSILSIGTQAFLNCTSLETLQLSSRLNTIGSSAFLGCSSLGSLTLPASLHIIESSAFKDCVSLQTQLPPGILSVGSGAFRNCTALTAAVIPDGMTAINSNTYYGCTALTTLSLSENVTSIGANAFYGCSALTSLHLPKNVAQIGANAFSACSGLTAITVAAANTVFDSRSNSHAIIETASNKLILGCRNTVIPDSVTAIGSNAFDACDALTQLILPDSVTAIGDYAFSGCTSLTGLTVPPNATSIGKYAFRNCSSITQAALPHGLTTVSEGLFYGCTALQQVTVPDTVTAVGNYAFYGCEALIEVTLPDNISTLSASLFSGCTSLRTFTIPAAVRTIGSRTFSGCTSLTDIVIPSGVSSIGTYAFSGCSSITVIDLPTSVTKVGLQAFRDCTGMQDIYIRNISCSIASGKSTIPEQAVIHGYLTSTAKTYAGNYNRSFEQL